MIQLLAPLLGGLGGLLFPAAGAAAAGGAAATGIGALLSKAALPALGAGLGTLVSGGGGKDAIRNALLMGVGVTALPGVASGIQQSGFGRSVTGGLANIFGAGADLVSGPQQSAAAYSSPPRRPAGMTSASGPATAPASAEEAMARTGVGTPGDRQSPMTTIPTISDINMVRPEGLQVLPQVSMVRPDYGTGIPATLPPVVMPGSNYNEADRYRGMQSALDMAADLASAGDVEGMYEGNRIYNRLYRPGLRGFAVGGEIEGPGTGTSDSIPAEIYQDGKPVQKAALSDGEFVMTADAVKGAGNGSRDRGVKRMYELMRRFESGEMV